MINAWGLVRVTDWGGACPFQAEGFIGNEPFYFRFRHGYASLTFRGETESFNPEPGRMADGSCSYNEFESWMNILVHDWAESYA